MKKETIRLTEASLRGIIDEAVSKLLREYKEEGDLDHRNPDSVYDYNKIRSKQDFDDYDKAETDFLRDVVKNSNTIYPFSKKEQNDYSWNLFTKRNDEKENLNTDYYSRQRQNNWLNLEQAQSAFF